MDPSIKAAIVGGIFIVLVPVINFIFQNVPEGINFFSSSRLKTLQGIWKGQITQREWHDGYEKKYEVTAYLEVKGFQVKGKCDYSVDGYKNHMNVKGGFHHDRFLRLNYSNPDRSRLHFGHIILELSPQGNTLSGEVIGFGTLSGKIISAKMLLKRNS